MKINNQTTSHTDEEIIKLSLVNPIYFEELVLRYQRPIVGFHYNFLKNKQDAEDLAQDTFLKIYTNLGRYNPNKGKFQSWAFRIAKNTFIDLLRKNKNRKEAFFSSFPTNIEEYFSDIYFASI